VKPNHFKTTKDLAKLGFFTAIRFLTIFPLPGRRDKTVENFGMSLPFFPLVGLLLGGILVGLNYGLTFILSLPVVYMLLIIVLVIMTGAHHIDGLIDTFDGIVIGKTRERRLEIMVDNRVGAFGITAAILIIMLKYISLLSVPVALPALLLMPVLSRWLMVTMIFIFPYARSAGMGLAFKQEAKWYGLAIATAIALAAAVVLISWRGVVLMAALWLISVGIGSYFRTRLGGLTGDVYGALNEIAEALVPLLFILVWR